MAIPPHLIRICPGCGQGRHLTQFIDEHGAAVTECSLCRVCKEPSVRAITAGAEASGRTSRVVEVSGDLVDDVTARNTMKRGATMPSGKCTCEHCGMEFGTRVIAAHREACRKGAQPVQAARPAPSRPEEPSTAVPPAPRPAMGQGGGNGRGCEGCLGRDLHGLNVAEVQVVEQAVMAGLSIEAASKIIKAAQAAGR